jgi:hypothetical protein
MQLTDIAAKFPLSPFLSISVDWFSFFFPPFYLDEEGT